MNGCMAANAFYHRVLQQNRSGAQALPHLLVRPVEVLAIHR